MPKWKASNLVYNFLSWTSEKCEAGTIVPQILFQSFFFLDASLCSMKVYEKHLKKKKKLPVSNLLNE